MSLSFTLKQYDFGKFLLLLTLNLHRRGRSLQLPAISVPV